MVFLTEMGASYVEEPPIWTSGAIALDDEAIGFIIGAISIVNSMYKKERRRSSEFFLKSSESSQRRAQ